MSDITETRQVLLIARPKGMPSPADFSLRTAALPDLKEEEVLIKTLYLSVDPYMRLMMQDSSLYRIPFPLNQPLSGGAVGEVIESKHSLFSPRDIVFGFLNWADYSVISGDTLKKIDPHLAPISTTLSILGMPGLTAYFGLFRIGQPKPGETVVVSGAAGAVGMIVGQMAKLKGCRVIGIAGGSQKVDFLTKELGFDAALDYKTGDLAQAIKDACPQGVDVYFDNVGGTVTDMRTSLAKPENPPSAV